MSARAPKPGDAAPTRWASRHRKKLVGLALIVAAPFALHAAIGLTLGVEPPRVVVPELARHVEGDTTRAGQGRTSRARGVTEVHLEGRPEELGAQHATLLYESMVANEREVWDGFAAIVPFAPARVAMFDFGRVLHRNVDRNFPEARRRELAAQAARFSPDPYAHRLPTYERMVFLHALYDISLGFEHSPLLGCSAFALGGAATRDGHTLVGRAFDFDVADVFDRDKAVFFVRQPDALPFASVSWPGLVGVLTGMNAEGLYLSVNGARARDPETRGVPVVFSLRNVLERARTTAEATALLSAEEVMVSHLVFVADARGAFAVVERAPHAQAHVISSFPDSARVRVTNHYEGPLKGDPRDVRVRATSTTLARSARLDEVLTAIPARSATPLTALAVLRDHECAKGEAGCALGDRRTLDALIATHGVIADTTARTLWVSAGPHLAGRFVGFDLTRELAANSASATLVQPEDLPADPLLADPRAYAEGRRRAGGPLLAPKTAPRPP